MKPDDGDMASDWYNGRHRGFKRFEQRGSAATVSDIPLVHVKSKTDSAGGTRLTASQAHGYGAEANGETDNKIVRGFDAV